MTKQKPKRGLMDQAINIFAVGILFLLAVNEFSHLWRSLDTIQMAPEKYEHHYSLSSTFPFVGSYYLMKPKDYNPKYRYPLVIALHGVSKHAYAAEELAKDSFRNIYPFFVMVPIAPKRAFWATPQEKAYQMVRNIPYPDHLPQVLAGIKGISSQYRIDKNKVMIVGHSMGGSGVIGALERYPETFKAGIASSGAWSPNEISNIKSPLFIFHGTKDGAVPYKYSAALMQAARAQRKPIKVTSLKGRGHAIGNFVYSNPTVWNSLLSAVD